MAKAKITKEELAEWQDLNAKRLELEREARTLEKRCDQILEKAADVLRESGKQSIKRFGFALAWVAGKASVSWKDAFVSECGPDKAAELQKKAVNNAEKKLLITPPAATDSEEE